MKRSIQPGKAVILLSGGLDSATVLAIAKAAGHELYAVTFDYHQRHKRELESARLTATALSVSKHLVIDFNLRDIGGSALTSDRKVPKNGVRDLGMGSGEKNRLIPNPQPQIPITYVPARNTIFLSFALAWAEVLEAGNIFIGANAVDYSGYPDCRPEYLHAFEEMANLATRVSVENGLCFHIRAPLISMTKAEIIRKGTELGVDYGLTWSCYDPQPLLKKKTKSSRLEINGGVTDYSSLITHDGLQPCRRCDSCRIRAKGFKEAGIKDPLIS